MQRAPGNDFEGSLVQTEELISGGHLEQAQKHITEVLGPNISEAEPLEQGRYHAVVGDWIAAWQRTVGVSSPEQNSLCASCPRLKTPR